MHTLYILNEVDHHLQVMIEESEKDTEECGEFNEDRIIEIFDSTLKSPEPNLKSILPKSFCY